jgi:tRNA(Ile)-lysidine synthase TilS/MesJ
MVGISGGKDSYALLDLLVHRNKNLPKKFRVEACHIRASDKPYKADE